MLRPSRHSWTTRSRLVGVWGVGVMGLMVSPCAHVNRPRCYYTRMAIRRRRPTIERVWTGALEKGRREGRCRLCPEVFNLQAAHTIARKHDEAVELEDGTWAIFVDPDDVVPLCVQCHHDYDARRVSIL